MGYKSNIKNSVSKTIRPVSQGAIKVTFNNKTLEHVNKNFNKNLNKNSSVEKITFSPQVNQRKPKTNTNNSFNIPIHTAKLTSSFSTLPPLINSSRKPDIVNNKP
jgi:hypothetical protein